MRNWRWRESSWCPVRVRFQVDENQISLSTLIDLLRFFSFCELVQSHQGGRTTFCSLHFPSGSVCPLDYLKIWGRLCHVKRKKPYKKSPTPCTLFASSPSYNTHPVEFLFACIERETNSSVMFALVSHLFPPIGPKKRLKRCTFPYPSRPPARFQDDS